MKLISAILSLYVLALTTAPCCSFDNCPDDKTQQAANHKSGDSGRGSCSPFFSCEECHCILYVSEQIMFNYDIILPAETNYAGLIFSFHSYDFHSIWEPPQLV